MAHSIPNFNIYEVLEPVKTPASNSVGILIDISNEPADSISKDLKGSDLDSIKKSEFDLVDLFQNIYVTPQHVKKPGHNAVGQNIDFNEFFEKIESGEKDRARNQNIDDCTEYLSIKNPTKSYTVDDKQFFNQSHKESSSNRSYESVYNYNEDINEDFERTKCEIQQESDPFTRPNVANDLINSYSNVKNYEIAIGLPANAKSMYNDTDDINEPIDCNIKPKGLKIDPYKNADINDLMNRVTKKNCTLKENSEESITKSIFNSSKKTNEELQRFEHENSLNDAYVNDLLRRVTNKTDKSDEIESNKTNIISHSHYVLGNYDVKKILKVPRPVDLNYGKVLNNNTFGKTFNDVNEKKVCNETVETRNLNVEGSKLNFEDQSIHGLSEIQLVKFDKKTYAKQRLTKTDREKIGFTEGPGLHEKSVVLPQILGRLAARRKVLEHESKQRKRLILDSGKKNPACTCQCSQNILHPGRESSGLRGEYESHRSYASHVPVPSGEKTVAKKDSLHIKTQPHQSLAGFVSLPSGGDDLKGKELHQCGSSQEFHKGFATGGDIHQGAGVVLNPTVAMEDCNRERFIAHRVRSAFEKFILTGSYY